MDLRAEARDMPRQGRADKACSNFCNLPGWIAAAAIASGMGRRRGHIACCRRVMDATAVLLQKLLLYGVLPLWMMAGFGDWLCHRVQRIEYTAGLEESALHWAMLVELGIGIAAALLLEINAATLALLLVVAIAHELTMWRDLSYAASRRRIAVAEQWVHGIQLALPWVALVLLVVIHRDQALAAAGLGSAQADWHWHRKELALPAATLAAIGLATVLLVLLPFAEEFQRCRRAAVERSAAQPSAAVTRLDRRADAERFRARR
jgi:hypothetical protein